MLLIAGLGNPGPSYAANRHNIGFMALDAIRRDLPFAPWSKKFQGEISEGQVAGEKVLLLKPQTFMNLSGQSVAAAAQFYKIEPGRIVVIHDELDLPPGKVRIKTGGGHGGHNGLKSVDAHLGKDYRRVRLGIGHPGVKELVNAHVLSDFAKSDRVWLEPLLEAIARNAEPLVRGEDAQFMNRIALAIDSDEPPSAKGSAALAAVRTPAKPKGRSHIHQARDNSLKADLPTSGPMAGMLRKLFGGKD